MTESSNLHPPPCVTNAPPKQANLLNGIEMPFVIGHDPELIIDFQCMFQLLQLSSRWSGKKNTRHIYEPCVPVIHTFATTYCQVKCHGNLFCYLEQRIVVYTAHYLSGSPNLCKIIYVWGLSRPGIVKSKSIWPQGIDHSNLCLYHGMHCWVNVLTGLRYCTYEGDEITIITPQHHPKLLKLHKHIHF